MCQAIRGPFVITLLMKEVFKSLNIEELFKNTMAQDYHHKGRLSKSNMTLPIIDLQHDEALTYLQIRSEDFNPT